MRFRRIRRVKRSVFAENAEWNGAFSAITRYLQKSGYVLGFNTYFNKIFLILGLGLVYYWMMPKNCEKRTIKSRACVPLSHELNFCFLPDFSFLVEERIEVQKYFRYCDICTVWILVHTPGDPIWKGCFLHMLEQRIVKNYLKLRD